MLKYILTEMAESMGYSLDDARDRSFLLRQVNAAAKTLYDTRDLKWSHREAMLVLPSQQDQITLPAEVGELWNILHRDSLTQIPHEYTGPRYVEQRIDVGGYRWRVKGKSVFHTHTTNKGVLTFSVEEALSEDVTMAIIGETPDASKSRELVVLAAGVTSVSSSKSWVRVDNLSKDKITAVDIKVSDVEGTEVSSLHNALLRTDFLLVQVSDGRQGLTENEVYEYSYKMRWLPFVNDEDIFPAGDLYDEAIIQLAVARAKGQDSSGSQAALILNGMGKDLADDLNAQARKNDKQGMNFAANPVSEMMDGRWLNGRY